MFASAQINSLHEKKRLLLMESEINRRVLALEWVQVKSNPDWPWRGWSGQWMKTMRPYLWVLAPAAGILLARSGGRKKDRLSKAVLLCQIAERIMRFWHQFSPPSKEP